MDVGKTIVVVCLKALTMVSIDKKHRKVISPGKYLLRLVEVRNNKFSRTSLKYFVLDSDPKYGLPANYWRVLEGRGGVTFKHKEA